MFLQVLMNWRDQQCLRFLWRNEESNRSPDVYVTKVMTFGATCSPSCAQYVKNHNAQRFQDKFPRAVEAIIREHYVDNMLSSVETEDEAIKLAELKANPGEESLSEMGTEKVLGLWWCTAADTFTFKVSSMINVDLLQGYIVPTKMHILSTLMTIYDPHGLLANFLMFLKILFQEIWRSGINWTNPLRANSGRNGKYGYASENGYAAVAYLRFEEDGEVECALVGRSHQLKPTKQFFWTDARNVLCWLNSDHWRYNQFVAIRISEILELTEVNEWNWIPTKLNVADDATKWQKLPDFSPASRWFSVPQFLWEAKEEWPVAVSSFNYTAEEKRPNVLHHSVKRVLFRDSCITETEARTMSSSLYGLSPFLDEEGLLRMKGRIDACEDVDDCMKRPILLPKCHPVTDLIISSVHQHFCHMNHQTTLNQIRSRFYVSQLPSAYKRVRARWQHCKIRQAKPVAPEMSALPPARLKAFCRPFSYVGIDYFGPMHVVVGRRTEKRWGVLITCLTVRAIYLEVAASQPTNAFSPSETSSPGEVPLWR
ncbi:uncharacterized protein LOC129773309 [Toxorhynchites rutilus septentrionalis]|uniref:uncharacterized protein LOC129773309 n=1 Tax=Toxorhynchites rutilus septentrionalis TaxID=329112 RepID=UPI00247A7F38|nr:uncharacterized protein LOC129773309 [Toxorhynchites rutilus septentrionalis]